MIQKTIREISDVWRENRRPYVKQSTLAAHMLILENHILPKSDENSELRESDVQGFVLEGLEGGLNMKSVKNILIVLKMVMKLEVKNEWTNYYERDIKYLTDVADKKLEVLSVANHKKTLNYIQSHFFSPRLGIYISLSVGLRIGEIYAPKRNDVSVYDGAPIINWTIEHIYIIEGERKRTEPIINTPKIRDSCREIPIDKELLTILKPLREIANDDYYILASDKHPIESRIYYNYYKKLMEKLDTPKLKYHGLRHSFATRCIKVGCDYKTVSVLLGHSDISTTLDLYIHPNMERKK